MTELNFSAAATSAKRIAALSVVTGLLFFGNGCRSDATTTGGGDVLVIYYVPIGIETLVGITTADIEVKGSKCTIESKQEIERIYEIINSARPAAGPNEYFYNKTVRVKILSKSQHDIALVAVIENQGSIMRPGGRQGVLSAKDLAALKRLIESH
jgi:hypothetical protein